jgi:hypothetical protein
MALQDPPKPVFADEVSQKRNTSALPLQARSPETMGQPIPAIEEHPRIMAKDDRFSWLSTVGTTVALGSALSFVLSVIYDWGFFRALDVELPTLPTNLSDHARAAINSVPSTALFAVLAAIYILLLKRSEKKVVKQPRFPRLRRFGNNGWVIPIWILTVAGPLLYLLFGARFLGLLAIGAPCLWLIFAHWLIGEPPLSNFRPLPLFICVAWLPAAALIVYSRGSMEGHAARELPSGHSISVVAHSTPLTATILRSIDKGILVLSSDKKEIQFLPWASVTAIKMPIRPEFQGWLAARSAVPPSNLRP